MHKRDATQLDYQAMLDSIIRSVWSNHASGTGAVVLHNVGMYHIYSVGRRDLSACTCAEKCTVAEEAHAVACSHRL